jgi:LysM repeat protein
MKCHRLVSAFLSSAALPVGAAALILACKGPERDERVIPIDLPDQAPMVVQWIDGPRRDNAEREMEKQAERAAAAFFQAEPMAREAPPVQAPGDGAAAFEEEPALAERPSWADGVERPADVGGADLPQGWPIEVRRGETPAVLGEWAGIEPQEIVTANQEALRGRKWLKVGDRITVTMSANQKVAFDRKREQFQKARVDAFFANRYFEKVIVYRVKKGEFIASAAKRYGDVPLWLIEEFNQMDFRTLQPGDEILIPVVGELPQGVRQPPPPVVVDEEGHPLSEAHSDALEPRLQGELFAKARMALDDSNVFVRPRSGPSYAAAAPAEVVAPLVGPVQAAGYPRPEQVLPSASIGGGLLPNYGGAPSAAPAPYVANAAAAPLSAGYPASPGEVAPAAPAKAPSQTPRDVVVRRGESLMHYVMWSKTSLDAIKAANQGHLDTDRIFIGARVAIPMSDDQYVQFVSARSEWEKQKAEAASNADKAAQGKSGGDKAGPKVRHHTVKSGETATSIARAHRIAVKELKAANPKLDLKKLKIGAKLVLPAKAK